MRKLKEYFIKSLFLQADIPLDERKKPQAVNNKSISQASVSNPDPISDTANSHSDTVCESATSSQS